MTRKEEITNKAKIRANQYSHPAEWNDCYHHWIEGAEWADKTMIEKACEWIKEKWDDNYTMPIIIHNVIEDFKNYMKGE